MAESELKNNNINLAVSAESVGDAADSFELIYVTFENKGDRWIKIEDVEVPIEPKDIDKISVVVGKDLTDWASAVEEREKLRQHNKEVALASVAAVGAVAAIATSKSESNTGKAVNATGGALVAGALSYALVDTISNSRTIANSPKKVPENHIYQPFSVPGKLFIRKWLLINRPSGMKIDELVLSVKTIDGERERYVVHF
jgi:hypothetical protein